MSNAEINRELAALKRAFSLAVKDGKLMVKPYIPMLKENNVRKGFFERDEFERVRSHLSSPLQPVVHFAYITGWRIRSEVLMLQWRQPFLAGRGTGGWSRRSWSIDALQERSRDASARALASATPA